MPVRGTRGFTLIELLIVVAILVILLGLLFPIAKSAKDQTDRNSCLNNLRLIAQAAQAYHQERGTYPAPPGMRDAQGRAVSGLTGARGIPDGGVTGLALSGHGLMRATLWCPVDQYPDRRIGGQWARTVVRDESGSSYAFGYNYYGYVTAADGTPFPVTSEEAARFLFGDPMAVDGALPADHASREWDLGLVRASGTVYSPHGMFRGLWNYRAPADTVVTFCPHHTVGGSKVLQVVTVGGEAHHLKYNPPINTLGNSAMQGGYLERKPIPGVPALKPGIDWRVNRGPYGVKDGHLVEDPNTIADVPKDAARMPIVEVHQAFFTADDLAGNMLPAAGQPYGWYDTQVDVAAGDLVMVLAHAQWCWVPNAWTRDAGDSTARWTPPTRGEFTNNRAYDELASPDEHPIKDGSGRVVRQEKYLWFSPEGDSIEARANASFGGMLLPGQPHNLLVGSLADVSAGFTDENDRRARVFAVGSRFGRLVTAADIPAGQTSTTLKLSLNDTAGAGAYADNTGWCEAWIAVYRRRDVNTPL